jgi:hypothetical protein
MRAESATIFDVLAVRARRHSARFLGVQAGVTASAAAVIFVLAAPWWPLGALLLAVGCYSLWGFLESRAHALEQRSLVLMKRTLVMLATLAFFAAATGTAFALFVGNGASPYGVCYGADGRAFSCTSRGERR